MIRTLLLVFTLVVALQAIDISEEYIRQKAEKVGINEEDVRTCAIMTNITGDNIKYLEDFFGEKLQTTDLENIIIRRRSFYNCMIQKKLLLQATNIERYLHDMTREVGVEKENVQTCAIKANITFADVQNLENFLQLISETTDLEDRVISIGCFLACMYQKNGLMSGAHINVDNIKKMISSTSIPVTYITTFRKMDTCVDRLKNETKECEVVIKYMMCLNE